MLTGDPHWGAAPPPAVDMEACAQTLAEARSRELRETVQAGACGVYLLIDPMLGDPVMPDSPPAALPTDALDDLRERAWGRATYATTLPAKLAMDGAFAPYLVELQGPQDPWLQASVHWAIQETLQSWTGEPGAPVAHRIGGWLQSSAYGPALADALSGWLRLKTSARTPAHYLRLADRRVLSLAVHVIGESLLSMALRPVQQWHWLDPHAAWRHLSCSPEATPQITTPTQGRALTTFSANQWSLMSLGEKVHAQMAQQVGHRLSGEPRPDPAHWPPVTSAQWNAALEQVGGHLNPANQRTPQ